MKQKYRLGTAKYISPGENFRRRFKFLIIFVLAATAVTAAFLYDFYSKKQTPQTPTTKTTIKKITFENKSFSTQYFSFRDSEDWKFARSQSAGSKFVFQKYLPKSDLVQHQLIVYVNSMPPTLELASSRVLPVELNSTNNGFSPAKVSEHCGTTYKPGEVRKVLPRQINGSTLLCDPDQGQFRVVLAKEGGDYNLKLKRADGTYANYIIIYQNQKIDPDPGTVMRIANSFESI
jgi:hypothetical protein